LDHPTLCNLDGTKGRVTAGLDHSTDVCNRGGVTEVGAGDDRLARLEREACLLLEQLCQCASGCQNSRRGANDIAIVM
jgi:hypothetical protein